MNIFGDPSTYYLFRNIGPAPLGFAESVPSIVFAIYELSFPILAAAIMTFSMHGSKTVINIIEHLIL